MHFRFSQKPWASAQRLMKARPWASARRLMKVRPLLIGPCMLAVVSLAAAGCAGYHIGASTMFPQNIRTVHVPVFESDSFRRGLGEWLTEAVVKEIELRPGYKVVNRARADSILEGRLIGDTRRVVVNNRFDDPREFEVTMRVQVRWLDNRGQLLTPATTIPVPDTLIEALHTTSLVAEVGQSNISNQQENIEQLAKQIVATMEIPW